MNKKGQMFTIIVIIFFVLAMLTLIIGANYKYETTSQILAENSGDIALSILNAYQEQEYSYLYLDLAAKISLYETLFELGEQGGFYNNNCGYAGYNLAIKNNQQCSNNVDENIAKLMKSYLSSNLNYPNVLLPRNHNIIVSTSESAVSVTGLSNSKVKLGIGTQRQENTCEISVLGVSTLTTDQINEILKDSPLSNTEDIAGVILSKAQETKINPLIALAFFNFETDLGINQLAKQNGLTQETYNLFNRKLTTECDETIQLKCKEQYADNTLICDEDRRCGICNYQYCINKENCYCGHENWAESVNAWFNYINEEFVKNNLDTIEKIAPKYAENNNYQTDELTTNLKEFLRIHTTLPCENQVEIVQSGSKISQETIDRVQSYNAIIEQAAIANGVESAFIKAILTQESQGYWNAISPTGCAGLMQFCYSTAGDYMNKDDLVRIGNVCAKGTDGPLQNYKCPQEVFSKDPRFQPTIAIPAAAKYLKSLQQRYEEHTHRVFFAIAAYNVGLGVIDKAVDRANEKTWQSVSQEITIDLLNEFSVYSSWSLEQKARKVEEVRTYVDRVGGYYQQWGGSGLTSSSHLGSFEYSANFRTQVPYDYKAYNLLESFIEDVKTCNDKVENCFLEKVSQFNRTNPNNPIVSYEVCEQGPERVYYDVIDNFNKCELAWGENCYCNLTEKYKAPTSTMKNFVYTFSANKEDNNHQIELKWIGDKLSDLPNQNINLNYENSFIMEFDVDLLEIDANEVKFFVDHDSDPSTNTIKSNKYDFGGLAIIKDQNSNLNTQLVGIDKSNNNHEVYNIKNEQLAEVSKQCQIPQNTFNFCMKTNSKLPVLENENIVQKESFIKFAVELNDNTPPPQVRGLTAQKLSASGFANKYIKTTIGPIQNEDVLISWTDNLNDVVAYEITLKTTLNSETQTYFIDEATIVDNLDSIEENELQYMKFEGNEAYFQLLLDEGFFNEATTVEVTGIDLFQNKADTATTIVLQELPSGTVQ